MHALPLSLYLILRAKLWHTLCLRGEIHSPYFSSTPICTLCFTPQNPMKAELSTSRHRHGYLRYLKPEPDLGPPPSISVLLSSACHNIDRLMPRVKRLFQSLAITRDFHDTQSYLSLGAVERNSA